jgi:hypothetical protein
VAIPNGEILNPKHEILNNIKTQNTNDQNRRLPRFARNDNGMGARNDIPVHRGQYYLPITNGRLTPKMITLYW